MPELAYADAEKILHPFVCNQTPDSRPDAEWQPIRDALQVVTQQADFLTLGICADSSQAALAALQDYLLALAGDQEPGTAAYDFSTAPTGDQPVYVKVNTQRHSLHWDQYIGEYRGVLVTCQSQDVAQSGGTYGHFPLNLFATAAA